MEGQRCPSMIPFYKGISMQLAGILKNDLVNTGLEEELVAVFSAPLTITSKKPQYINETLTLKRRVSKTEIQRWEISTGIVPVSDASALFTKIITHGYSEIFQIRVPQIYRNNSVKLMTTFESSAAYSSNENILYLLASDTDSKIPVGEFIRFQGHSKVYLVEESAITADDPTLAQGFNKIKIFPNLVKPIVSGADVFHGDRTSMNVMLGEDTNIGITYQDGILAGIEGLSLVEAL